MSNLQTRRIPATAKGFAAMPSGTTAAQLASGGATLFDGRFTWPLLTLRERAVGHNIEQLARFCRDAGVRLAPHAKTTMAPQLFERQLAAGAWGLTAATIAHVRVYRDFGVRRILLANQLVDAAAIGWLAGELARDEQFDFFCYVDSVDGVRLLDRALAGTRRRVQVLVELGHTGGRTGCRGVHAARTVARAAAATGTLTVAGVAGYEGGLPDAGSARAFCAELVGLLEVLRADGMLGEHPLVTAGGSTYPDVAAEEIGRADGATAVLRSGAYIAHDDGLYAHVSPFTGDSSYALQPALELWTQVLSRPEPELVILGAGRRDIGHDQGMPGVGRVRAADAAPTTVDGMQVTRLNDQHAYLAVPAACTLRPADLVSLTISHPCTTFDRWTHIPLLDDTGRVLDVVHTFF